METALCPSFSCTSLKSMSGYFVFVFVFVFFFWNTSLRVGLANRTDGFSEIPNLIAYLQKICTIISQNEDRTGGGDVQGALEILRKIIRTIGGGLPLVFKVVGTQLLNSYRNQVCGLRVKLLHWFV